MYFEVNDLLHELMQTLNLLKKHGDLTKNRMA